LAALSIQTIFLVISLGAIPLSFALLGFFMQLLELFRLLGARLAITFRTLLTVIWLADRGDIDAEAR